MVARNKPLESAPSPLLMSAIVIAGLLFGSVAAVFIAWRVDELYLVQGRILLQIGRELGSVRSTMVGENASVQANPRREDVNTESEMLSSPALIKRAFDELVQEKVIPLVPPKGFLAWLRRLSDSMELTSPKTVEHRTLEKWSQALAVYAVAGSNVLGIDCRTNEPEIGKALLKRMVQLYLDAHVQAYSTGNAEPFFRSEVARLETALLAAESDLSEFRLASGVIDPDVEKGLALTRRGEAEASQRSLITKVAAARARVTDLERSLGAQPETIVTTSERKASLVRDDFEKRVADAERGVIEAEQQYSSTSPFLARARTTYERLRALLEQLPRERDESRVQGQNPVRTTAAQELIKATAELRALEAELASADQAVAHWTARSVAIESTRVHFLGLNVRHGKVQKDLAQALTTAQLARISKQLDDIQVANVTVIVPPTIVPTPIRTLGLPTRVAVVVQGALLGIVLGLACAFWLHAVRARRAHTAGSAQQPPTASWDESHGVA